MDNLISDQSKKLSQILKTISDNHEVEETEFYHWDITKYGYMSDYEKESFDNKYLEDGTYDDGHKNKYELLKISGADKSFDEALKRILGTISCPNTDCLHRLITLTEDSRLVLRFYDSEKLEGDYELTYLAEYVIYIRIIKNVIYDEEKFFKTIEVFNNLRIYNKEFSEED